jgi:hypothetical protein
MLHLAQPPPSPNGGHGLPDPLNLPVIINSINLPIDVKLTAIIGSYVDLILNMGVTYCCYPLGWNYTFKLPKPQLQAIY